MLLKPNLTAVVVEDEIASQEYLTQLLAACFPQMTVAAVAEGVQAGISAIDAYRPDLVFLDVEIKMGTGFDVLAGLTHKDAQVIFTTAFDQFAIDAFRYHAVDYLLKPLNREQLVSAVQRCIERAGAQQSGSALSQLLQYLKLPQGQQRLPVPTMYGLEFVSTEEILFAVAEGNYSRLKLKSGKFMMLTKKIKDVEALLREPLFVRIHNSYLVNVASIRKYYKGRGGHVVLEDESSLPVAPGRRDHLLRLFAQ